ncbi:site-specific DNA-methyltransferase [Bartonella krasnovii]|uniref:site-specific DNA-methyltransferase (adenine-specific) n=3 Tax=Bartonella TaxID=773 RepID=A0A5B9D268_9HYPH|nr:site-specific DNA-methyltransferase [Bartonella krasnovii]QEE12656.1 site-specific DNA-methyltransferase [Bartonella krasnovii]UNF43491.1 site-specific DNA-methyltransferase [Bartonella krasnovii]UNF55038.1 site-specific DNA-methyltransferase [Bartonella krasnovii]
MEKLDGKSMDIVEQNIKQFKQLFPEVFSEGKIKFDQLQELLGNYIIKDEDHYNFTWHGKRAASRLAQTPSTGTLRPCKQESIDWDTTQNLFIEGDNLEVLKLLQKSYHRQVKMIYIDPPYNTGNDFVYKDDFKDGVQNYLEMTGQLDNEGKKIGTNSNSAGRYHTNWLNMMYPRLKLARNLLRDDGVIFISIDDKEQVNLKKLCDEVFGEENFIESFVWHKKTPPNNVIVGSVHEYICMYAKNKECSELFLLPRDIEKDQDYKNPDNDPRGRWKPDNLTAAAKGGRSTKSLLYTITNPITKQKHKPPKGRMWAVPYNIMQQKINNGTVYWGKNNRGRPMDKRFLKETRNGRVASTLLNDVGTNSSASKYLNKLFSGLVLFETPKPVNLLQRLLQISTTQNDLILDFFAGSGTTAHAVMQLNAEDGGKRRCILVQLPEPTEKKSEAFKAGYKNIAEISKERLRRAGKKIKEEQSEKLNLNANGDLDTGFKVFKLDSSNIKHWEADFDTLGTDLINAVDYLKQDRSNEDLLYEILLKYGLDLTVSIEIRLIAQKNIYIIGHGALIICLDTDIDMDVIKGIGTLKEELKPDIMRVVFKDDSFKDDVIKTNALMCLKRYGISDVKSL